MQCALLIVSVSLFSMQAPAPANGDGEDAPKESIKERATKVVNNATDRAKAGAAKAAKVGRETYEKVKEKTAQYRKEIGERTAKVAHATTEATLDAIGKALTYAENSKGYLKSVLSKEALKKMRENAMKKYPQYFTGEADKNRQAFQDFLAQGAEPVFIEHGKQTQVPFRVNNGDVVRWNFRVLNDDVEFSVNIRKMQVGGAVEETVHAPKKFKAGKNHMGSYSFVYSAGAVVITWSNAYSWFKGKHVAYIAEVVTAEEAAKVLTTGHIDVSDTAEDAAESKEDGEAQAETDAVAPPAVDEEDDAAEDRSEPQQLPAVASEPAEGL